MSDRIFIVLVAALLFVISCSKEKGQAEVTVENAIEIAAKYAAKKNFDAKTADVEVIKVKKGIEKGPMRMVFLLPKFPKDRAQIIFNSEFWVIYFYPRGTLEKANTLGGDFIVLVDLYSGNVIESVAGL
jgi:hypothetical protein